MRSWIPFGTGSQGGLVLVAVITVLLYSRGGPAGWVAGSPAPSHRFKVRRDPRGTEQVWVPPGCFRQGSNRWRDWLAEEDETPAHEVCLSRGFWLDRYEVSNAAFANFVSAGGYSERRFWSDEGWSWKASRLGPDEPPESGFRGPDQPQVWISWYEAEAYARWRNARLPTEAQWEYAARGPSSPIYPWGDRWDLKKVNVAESDHRPAQPKFLRTATVSVTSYEEQEVLDQIFVRVLRQE